MAKLSKNMLMYGANGGLGNYFYTKQWKGETIVCMRPRKRPGPGTPAQQRARQMMAEADIYARKALDDPKLAHFYEEGAAKRGSKLNAHNLAVRDFFGKPEVEDLRINLYSGKPGNEIIIDVDDDFMVAGVWVAIYNSTGTLVEEGPATDKQHGWVRWKYIATELNTPEKGSRIVATAYDLAGNSTSLEAIVD
ncbi:hypothetical protein [Flavihumibacter solisilvae]|uniref:Uncharacterized protein n=1 Tax=Flavihumibacter solisilvae TaxID=1349421 RepID=A0A0C1L6E4_9BACT|nr:hypothetical protein [Flavihumibacter solisilvae]KIC95066.1 hypothetical protein OI18_09320 [Flavihumibacter solisilvae]